MPGDRLNVLITGFSPGGIGHALAREYHSQGLRVIASARRMEALADLKAIGMDTILLDVTDTAAITAAKEQVHSLTGGKLDILVNNAGIYRLVPAIDLDLEDIQSIFMTNLFGVMLLCKEFAPLLIAAQGKIVNIGSVAAMVPVVFSSAYNASKAALLSYGDTLRVEMEPFGVQVVTVVTGGVATNIIQNKNFDININPGSLYYPMRDLYHSRRPGSSKLRREFIATAEDYARYVVSQTMRARPRPWLWRGSYAFIAWVLSFMPTGFMDGVMSRRFGLDIFKKRLAEASATQSLNRAPIS